MSNDEAHMEPTYTYDPSKMQNGGKDQMRFELQDIAVGLAQQTCVLSDQEYDALLAKVNEEGGSWKTAKYRCLCAIVMRMAYEVDFSADGLSLSLSQRYERWKALKHEMEGEMQHIVANPKALGKDSLDGGHYFYSGMNDNPRATFCPWPFREV